MTEYIFPVKHSIAAASCSARCWLVVSSCCSRAAASRGGACLCSTGPSLQHPTASG